jgi:MFS family permease
MPIVVPFYESNGLSMKDIMILQAVYSVAIVVLEVPSGYLADVIGRRKTLILGAMFLELSGLYATYSLSLWIYRFSGG